MNILALQFGVTVKIGLLDILAIALFAIGYLIIYKLLRKYAG